MEEVYEAATNVGILIGTGIGWCIKLFIEGIKAMLTIAGFVITYIVIAWLYNKYCYTFVELKKQNPEKYKGKKPVFYRFLSKILLFEENRNDINRELKD